MEADLTEVVHLVGGRVGTETFLSVFLFDGVGGDAFEDAEEDTNADFDKFSDLTGGEGFDAGGGHGGCVEGRNEEGKEER